MNTLILGAGLRLLRFCFLKGIITRVVSLREQLFQTVRRLAGNILHGDALADVGGVVMRLRVWLSSCNALAGGWFGKKFGFYITKVCYASGAK